MFFGHLLYNLIPLKNNGLLETGNNNYRTTLLCKDYMTIITHSYIAHDPLQLKNKTMSFIHE